MKYILGIQTAEFPNEIALVEKESKKVYEHTFQKQERSVEQLGIILKDLLKKAHANIEDIDLVTVCLGPGSYTGLRGGLAFGKGFCQFRDVRLVGVSAFGALQCSVKSDVYPRIFMMDARNERVFFQYVEKPQTGLETIEDISVDHVTNVIKNVREATLFIGSGAVKNSDLISKQLQKKARFAADYDHHLQAEKVAIVGNKMYEKDDSIFTKDYLYKVKPLYILPPSITRPK